MNRTENRQADRAAKLAAKLNNSNTVAVLPSILGRKVNKFAIDAMTLDESVQATVIGLPLVPDRIARRKQNTPQGLIIYPAHVAGLVTGPIVNAA